MFIVETDSFPIKKCTVKTTPAMSLQSVIDQACALLNLVGNYSLMYKKLPLQASLSVRLANVPSGTKLLLVAKGEEIAPAQITIALQTQDHPRFISKFSSDTSFWDVLRYFENENNINLTRKTVEIKDTVFQKNEVYVLPVCVFMNREFQSIRELKGVTLKSLGLFQGNAVIRLLGKVTDNPIETYLPEIELNDSVALQKNVPVPGTGPNQIISTKPSEILTNSLEPRTSIVSISDQLSDLTSSTNIPEANEDSMYNLNFNVDIYKPAPEGITEKIKLPDSFFQFSSAELKMMIDSQKSKLQNLENKPLMTKAMREREEDLKRKKHPKTMIRIKFSDGFVLEATFQSRALVSNLVKVVQDHVDNQDFRLYISPPQKFLDPALTFWEHGLAPASVVHLQGNVCLLSQLKDSAKNYPLQETSIKDILNETNSEIEMIAENESPSHGNNFEAPLPKESKKLPKWFKLQ